MLLAIKYCSFSLLNIMYNLFLQLEQCRVQEELDCVTGGRSPKLSDLPSLPYVEAAVAEAQRIRSVVPVGIPHSNVTDLDFCGYRIPKKSMIVPLQWAVHMDPEYWPEPERFQPERFLDENGRFFKPDSFIPFQLGEYIVVTTIGVMKVDFSGSSSFIYYNNFLIFF